MRFSRRLYFLRFVPPVLLVLFFLSLTHYGVRRAPWYEQALWNLVGPPQKLFRWMGDATGQVWHGYLGLVGVQRANDTLRVEVAALQRQIVALEEARAEGERLKALLAYRDLPIPESVVARVVANDPRAEFKSLTIDRGRLDGVDVLMPVMGEHGLVGRIGKVGNHRSLVLLIADPNSSVDVVDQRSRQRALLVGTASRSLLRPGSYITRLEYLRRVSDVQSGDVLVTSGFDQVFPAGLPVGTVAEVTRAESGVFQEALVIPFENFSEVREVLVLKTVGTEP